MKILFDQGTPVPLRNQITSDTIDTVAERGWSRLRNGDLLDKAEADGYDALVTTDQNLKCQQNLEGRKISILVLMSTSWPKMQGKIPEIRESLESMEAGGYTEVPV